MIDINEEAVKSLSKLDCKVVYSYPKVFTGGDVVSYYNLTEKGAFYADNSECVQDGYIQIDVWSAVPKRCFELSQSVNALLTSDGWTREMSMDVPKDSDKIYHRTMRFQKYFTV